MHEMLLAALSLASLACVGLAGCGYEILPVVALCGDAEIGDGEVCDDGLNNGLYGGCEPDCLGFAEYCGDGELNGPERCDDGVNNGVYGFCGSSCLGPGPYCGDGRTNGLEDCDDHANEDETDGCFSDCTSAVSCLDILDHYPNATTGTYLISPKPGYQWLAMCDMETDGGGWTGITLAHTCNGDLDSLMTAREEAVDAGISNEMCRPFTRDEEGNHTYTLDIEFSPGFSEFYLSGYMLRKYAAYAGEIDGGQFKQTDWDKAYGRLGSEGNLYGDVSFGSADAAGPVTSFAAEGVASWCQICVTLFPSLGPDARFDVALTSTFRIGWGEGDEQSEGWFPWWSGTIFVR